MSESDEETQARWRANAPKKIVAVKLVIWSNDGNVLLVKPTYKKGWQFPGGGVDLGEAPAAAVVREVREELGLKVEGLALKQVGVAFQSDNDAVLVIYELQPRLPEGSVFTVQEGEIEAYKFFSPEEVPQLISDYYADFWEEYTSG